MVPEPAVFCCWVPFLDNTDCLLIDMAVVHIEHALGAWSTACTCSVLQVKDYVEDPLNLVGKIRTRTSNELLKVPGPRLHKHCNTQMTLH